MSETAITPEEEAPETDTEEEFRALYNDSQDGSKRLLARAAEHEKAGRPDLAEVYREVNGNVLSLLSDMAATCGGAFRTLEDNVEELFERDQDDPVTESVLLETDSKDYVGYFEQILRFIDELTAQIVPGATSSAQRDILATLRRLTEDRIAFTKSITVEPEEDEEEDETEDDKDADEKAN